MTDHNISAVVSVILGLIGLATIAVLVSNKGNTVGVFSAGGGAISQAICTALTPVVGGGGAISGIPGVGNFLGNCTPNVQSKITF